MTQAIPMDTAALHQADLKHVWHPFTQYAEWRQRDPLMIECARGAELYDTDGNSYLDAIGSLWVGVHGHRHPVVDKAVQDQLEKVAHSTFLGLSHRPAVELATQLVELVPGNLNRVFYSDSGSTAVEVALKMAFQAQQQRGQSQRTRFASLREAYHGDTVGSVSVGGIDLFHGVYKPLLFESTNIDCPDHYEDEDRLAQAACKKLDEVGEELVAIVVEPLVQGAAGMRMHSPRFLDPVLAHARRLGALVVVDEVATGFGRTGTLFASEQLETTPDLMCLGKGLTNGYLPLAVTLATEKIFEAFTGAHAKTFFHGHTYTANPLGCAAAIATLNLFREEETMAGVDRLVEVLGSRLAPLEKRKDVARVRQKGLMVGIDLLAPDGAPLDSAARTGHQVCMAVREHGVILRPLGDTVVMMPPLCMTPAQIGRVVEVFEEVMDARS